MKRKLMKKILTAVTQISFESVLGLDNNNKNVAE